MLPTLTIASILLQANVKGEGEEQLAPAFIGLPFLVVLAVLAVGIARLFRRRPSHRLQGIFIILALFSLAARSVLLMLTSLGIGISDPRMAGEARAFAFLIVWPVTTLAVWLFGGIALAAGGRGLLVVLYLVA